MVGYLFAHAVTAPEALAQYSIAPGEDIDMLTWSSRSRLETPSDNRFRLVALDVDAVLQPGGGMHPSDTAAIRTAHAAGIKVVLASANPPGALHRHWANLGLGTPVIALNGALVYDYPLHRHLLGQPIELETLPKVVRIVQETAPKATLALECSESWAVSRLSAAAKWYTELSGRWPASTGKLSAHLEMPVYQLWIEAAVDRLEALESELTRFNLAVMRRVNPDLLTVRSAAASRGWALANLATALDVPLHQIIAIGGDGNDRSMLQTAAFAVATSDAQPLAQPLSPGSGAPATMSMGVAEALARYVVNIAQPSEELWPAEP